jgi:DNA-binding NarL/FixJ family response regulator
LNIGGIPHTAANRGISEYVAETETMSKSILIVDDNEPVRDVLHSLIEAKTGFEVSEASNGEEAIGKALMLKPDLVVLDLALSPDGINGVEAASLLKTYLPQTRILVFTMYGEMLGKSLTGTIGIDAVVSKSDGVAKVIEFVEKLLPPDVNP